MLWRLLHTAPLPGADNMALDEALLQRARETGEAICRVYSWTRPTLSLGRNQTAAGRYDLSRARELGVDVVRRPTGGRAVLHHREITYSVSMPAIAGLRESYERINRLLTRALGLLGAAAAPAGEEGRAAAPSLAPCFELPTRHELVVDGRKLVGSAQWREEGALVQHGSILVDDDQGLIRELTLEPLPPVPAPATLRAVLGRAPSSGEMADALLVAVRETEDASAEPWPADDALRETMARLRERYLDEAWTWRR